jgi:uncharacterized membrane protein YbaN (DUF454 family)
MKPESMRSSAPVVSFAAKAFAAVAILVCLVVGAIGLVLPIVPGILFLGLAALIAARWSPALERALRRNPTLGGYLDKTAGFERLSWPRQIELGAWLALKAIVDSIAWAIAVCARLLRR